jgi:hypothetical protein
LLVDGQEGQCDLREVEQSCYACVELNGLAAQRVVVRLEN